MTKALQTFAFSTLFAFAATAAQAEPLNFSRDGIAYKAHVTTEAGGATRITGKVVNTGERFTLLVRDGRVAGDFAGSSVAFATPQTPATLLSSR